MIACDFVARLFIFMLRLVLRALDRRCRQPRGRIFRRPCANDDAVRRALGSYHLPGRRWQCRGAVAVRGMRPFRAADPLPTIGSARRRLREGVDWTGLFRASGRFLAIEHGFRLLTEPGTREGLKGSFIHNYASAVGGLHGWADGDEFYVNYVGHPMQGSVVGFLWVGNDVRYRRAEFGKSPVYWKSRLRAAGFAWVYSTQFEIGAFSEASIGAIQATPPQQGFVDHVITPTVGMGWMVAEDVLDQIPCQTRRGGHLKPLDPHVGAVRHESIADLLPTSCAAQPPWHRDTREGISRTSPLPREATTTVLRTPPPPSRPIPRARRRSS